MTPLAAWNDTGHKAIGLLTYAQLSPEARSGVDDLLPAHPHYDLLLSKDRPNGTELALWVFLQATTWPDMVRPAPGKPREITRHHKADWHYINLPYVWPSDADRFAGAQFPQDGKLLSAIAAARTALADKTEPKSDRAVHLTWLLHLVGDLHQPLHTSAMFSERNPKGDQGGNLVGLRRGNSVVKLHAYWDAALGTGDSMRFLRAVAGTIESAFLKGDRTRPLPELQVSTTPEAWAKESFDAAVEYAYQEGRLAWRPAIDWDRRAETGVTAADFPALDPDYAILARDISRRRAALAATRMAHLLNELFP